MRTAVPQHAFICSWSACLPGLDSGVIAMDSETVIAASAVVIAVASLVVSVLQGRAARRHNRNSVRPLLVLQRTWCPAPWQG